MKIDRSWSLDIKPIYDDPDPIISGALIYHFASVLKAVRVALKSGDTEVLTFHAVRPNPPYGNDNDHDFMTIRAIERGYKSLDLNPLQQLMEDAELGRKVREAGLEFKSP